MSSVMLILLPFNIPPFLMRELRSAYDIQLSDSLGRSLQSKLLIYVCGKRRYCTQYRLRTSLKSSKVKTTKNLPENVFPVLEVFKSNDHRFATSDLGPGVHSWHLDLAFGHFVHWTLFRIEICNDYQKHHHRRHRGNENKTTFNIISPVLIGITMIISHHHQRRQWHPSISKWNENNLWHGNVTPGWSPLQWLSS